MRKAFSFFFILSSAFALFAFSKEMPYPGRFALEQTNENSFISYYADLLKENERVLLTSDLMFYSEHLMLDYSLFYIEEKFLRVELDAMLDYLIEGVTERMASSKKESLRESYLTALSYLLVSKRCLDEEYPLSKPVRGMVESELAKIEEHKGFEESFIFAKKEDFSQYIPRGHYTRSENLKKYFKAMMYLMRMRFASEIKDDDRFRELKAGLILSSVLKGNKKALNHYDRIRSAVSAILQQEDDLKLTELADSINEKIDDDFLADGKKLAAAKETAVRISKAKILSDYKEDKDEKLVYAGFMGQRYIFDSEVFQNLVYDNVTSYLESGSPFTLYDGVRAMPRGLDLMYVLGSGTAYEILKDEGDVQYQNYSESSARMIKKAKELTDESFYNRMLLQYKNVIKERKESSPAFMLDEKYMLKELNTLLASWTSLRHDVILYAKQSYTVKVTSAMPKEKDETRIIAEAYGSLYKSMAEDAGYMTDMLYALFKDEYLNDAGKALDSLASIYDEVSETTLKGGYYSERERVLDALLTLDRSLKCLLVNQKETQDKTAIVSDVHTDSNSERVLQEAVGNILLMTADYKDDEYIGGALSYYEFKKPMGERMTDEEWREYIEGNDPSLLLFKWQKKLYD